MEKKIMHTSIRYILLAAVFLLLGFVLVFLPDKENKKEMKPEHMLSKLVDQSRFLNSDEIAEKLINNDPSILLIDLRSKEEFSKGSLPGAMNIELENILSEEALKVFNRSAYDKVIFGNSDSRAEQAWILLSRNLVERTYILKGGLNHWVKTIVNPVKPDPASPIEDFELYNFRLGASRYFSGQNPEFKYSEKSSSSKPKNQVKKKTQVPTSPIPVEVEEEEEDEGC